HADAPALRLAGAAPRRAQRLRLQGAARLQRRRVRAAGGGEPHRDGISPAHPLNREGPGTRTGPTASRDLPGSGPRVSARQGRVDHLIAPAFADEVLEVGRPAELVAAFDAEALAGDPARLGAGEVADAGGDVVRHAGAAERLLLEEELVDLGLEEAVVV